MSDRHPATTGLERFFEKIPLASKEQAEEMDQIRTRIKSLAFEMVERCPDGPELTTGLRKLLEAKDCFVRAVL
jgi:hypothetical protein